MAGRPPVCSLRDVAVYRHDLELLRPGQWLNDTIISYFFESFRESAADESADKATALLLLEPAVAFMAAMFREPELLKEALSVRTRKTEPSIMELLPGVELLVLPINDKDDPNEHSGGSHWSLLCYRGGCFEHYDSNREQNAYRAKEVARCLGPLLKASTTPKVVQMAAPQQANGYDCGMFVLAIAKKLCALLLEDDLPAVGEVHASIKSITPLDISGMREQLYASLQAQERGTYMS